MQTFTEKIRHYRDWIILPVLLCIAEISHAYNMFQFPYYMSDEGTYMSQAWSVLTQGKLAPYTYWYDHAPAGWLLIAAWVKLTGGFFTFGMSINSGRVLMLVLHIAIAAMLYFAAKKLSGSSVGGIIAVLIFSLSPLGIYFQRQVLLDNIMTFWIFASLMPLLKDKVKLTQVMFSGFLFGIAVLTKENAIFFLPGFIYAVYLATHPFHRRFAIGKWLAIALTVISVYILYALIKSEFFPPGWFGGTVQHVSLIGSLLYQASRDTGLPFWNAGSDFHAILVEAFSRDRFSVILGCISLLGVIILSTKKKIFRIPVILILGQLFFLMRGGLVINFYILPLLPLFALCDGLIIVWLLKKMSIHTEKLYLIAAIVAIGVIGYIFYRSSTIQYTDNATAAQTDAVEWIKQNVNPDAYLSIDDYAYVDLHAARFPGDSVFPNADWGWKIQDDPTVQTGKSERIQYILLGNETVEQINSNNGEIVKEALNNASPVASFTQGTTAYLNLPNYISTNGDLEMVYKVNSANEIQLATAWQYYKAHFIMPAGNVVDASQGSITTSEGQSYAMLRAVMMGDQSNFNNIWAWTQDHLEYRTNDKLFSWLWSKNATTGVYQVGDSNTATDADEDIALSLVLASKEWNDPTYLAQAMPIIDDIWSKEVVPINGHYYLASSVSSERPDGLLVDPSYIAPATYKIFGIIDPSHPWDTLSNDSYAFLNELANQPGNTSHLPPNNVIVTPHGAIESAITYAGSGSEDYGYDAFRVLWRVALDSVWFNDPQAQQYLSKVTPFFISKINEGKLPGTVIDLKGNDISTPDSLATDAGMVAALSITDPSEANTLYSSIYADNYNQNGYWGDPTNYYNENWAWFMEALHTDQFTMPFSPALWTNTISAPPPPDYNSSDLNVTAPVMSKNSNTTMTMSSTIASATVLIVPPTTVQTSTPLPAPQPTVAPAPVELSLPYTTNSFRSTDWGDSWGASGVTNGILTVRSNAHNTSGGIFLNNSNSWKDYVVTANVDWVKGQEFKLVARRTDFNNYLECVFSQNGNDSEHIDINRLWNNQSESMSDEGTVFNAANNISTNNMEVSMQVHGQVVSCSINNATIFNTINIGLPPVLFNGGIGFITWDPTAGNSQIIVKNLSVTENTQL